MRPTLAGECPKDDHTKGHRSGYLCRTFKLFSNVRPVRTWPQLDPLVPDLDVTIIRENTEGFYPDRNLAWGDRDSFVCSLCVLKYDCRRAGSMV